MGLLDYLQNLEFKPTPNSIGLLNLGANMMQASSNQAQPVGFGAALGAGMQGYGQGYGQQIQADQMQQLRQLQQEKLKREQAQLEAMKGLDFNDPNAATNLLRSGLGSEAMQLYKMQNPSKSVDPYFTPQIGRNGEALVFDNRSGSYKKGDINGEPVYIANQDPVTKANITRAQEGQESVKVTLPDGREVNVPKYYLDGFSNMAGTGQQRMPRPKPALPQQMPPNYERVDGYNGTGFAVKSPQDRQALTADGGLLDQAAETQQLYNQRNGIQQGQSTADEAAQKKIGEQKAEAETGLNQRLQMYDNIIREADKGISALGPQRVDKLSGNPYDFKLKTGGYFPAGQELIQAIANNPDINDLQTAGALKNLQAAQDFLKGQGQVSNAERDLVSLATSIDPYKYDSLHNYKELINMKEKAIKAKEAAMKAAKGDFSPPKKADNVDDLVNHYLSK